MMQQPRIALRARRPTKAPRQPQLPAEDLKVILRLHGGFDAAQLRTVAVRDGVLRATGISYDEACSDTLPVNIMQNTLTMSTPTRKNAMKYSKIANIRISAKDYEAAAYITAPEDTSKGDRPSHSRERPGAANGNNGSRGGSSRSRFFPMLSPGEGREQAGDPSPALDPCPDPGPGPVQRSRRRRHHSHGRTSTNSSRDQARSQTNNNRGTYVTAGLIYSGTRGTASERGRFSC
ncbi:hypothetical protein HPB47_016718 [Ixodes persulcatus]|uniref:Uncharacterized protein n=1 Tax=Ixodes persulcatus TaxID=34615 RepID=A0AC60QQ59_IXOPE|nr:hypothetical protein HPB47_016718 [Ixodes persulcatus]